jgi:hypothetical protein
MARIFIDGFEHGDVNLWGANTGCTLVTASTYGMDGNYCLECTGASDSLVSSVLSAFSEIYVAFLVRLTALSTAISLGNSLFTFWDSASDIGGLFCYNGSFIFALDVYTGTRYWIALSPTVISINTTYKIELYYKMADSGGRAVLKVDGITKFDFTGDTKPYASTTLNGVRLGSVPTASGNLMAYAYFDNIVLDTSSYPGETTIQVIKPDGAGNSAQWTTSVSTPNWQCVDEVPPSDTDYVYTNAVDQVDTYALGSLVGSISSIKCVQAQTRIIKEGSATPQNINLVLRTNSTNYASSDIAVPTAIAQLCNLWETNPSSTGVPWDVTAVNALEAGIKSKT